MSVNSIALTIDEASEYTGIGRNTLRQLIAWQKIPTLYIGRRILIRREILERFIELNEGKELPSNADLSLALLYAIPLKKYSRISENLRNLLY